MTDNQITIGEKIKRIIDKSDLSVNELASKLGMTNQNLYKILKKDSIESKLLLEICSIIDVDIHDLFENQSANISGNQIAFGDNNSIIQGKKNKGTINYSGNVPQTNQGQSRSDCSELELENKYLKQKVKDLEILIEQKERMIEEKERMIQLLIGNKGK